MQKLDVKYFIRIIIILVLLSNMNKGIGQSLPLYSQYMYNMVSINPAFAGSRGVPSFAAILREQWSGLPGAPTTKSFTFDLPSDNKKMGFGVQLFEDKYVNYIKRSGINLSYNVKVQVSENGVLSLGLKGGFYNDSKNLTDVNLGLGNSSYDAAYSSNMNKVIPLAGAGIMYIDDKFYAGFSIPDVVVLSNRLKATSDKNLFQVNEQHYFFTTGYSFDMSEDIKVKPSFLLKAVSGAPIQFDYNTNIWLRNFVSIGGSYRTNEAVLVMAEIQASPQIRFGYAYDMPFKRPNSNELFVRYEYGKLFPRKKSFKLN